MDLFVGVDLAVRIGKRLPVAVLSAHHGVYEVAALKEVAWPRPPSGPGNAVLVSEDKAAREFAEEAAGYIAEVARHLKGSVRAVAIDAPGSPRSSDRALRASEEALCREGLSFFKTPSREEVARFVEIGRAHLTGGGERARLPHANQIWMLAGFALFEAVEAAHPDAVVLEVYPQATFAALSAARAHKSSPGGLAAQTKALASQLGMDGTAFSRAVAASCWGSGHDKLDALSAAWVASLPPEERVALGEVPHDAIWVPRSSAWRTAEARGVG